jgi:hypothetical protein
MITDMDMLPMNRSYYTEHITSFDNSKFIYLRDNVCFDHNEIAMCYNVATPIIWKEIFEINSIEDIRNMLISTSENNIIREGQGNVGWSTDQVVLYKKVMEWNKKTNNLVCLKENNTKFHRLNRGFSELNDNIKKNISNGIYSDYHCFRPMSQYSTINYDIYNNL